MLQNKKFTPKNPSSVRQLYRVFRHEPPSFALQFILNASNYTTQKYFFRNKSITKKIHGNLMQFNLDDPGISRSLILVGDREREHRYILEKVIKDDSTILDLGANIGYYVLLENNYLSKNSRIIAIEPDPINFEQLINNLKLNSIQDKVITINAAVSDQDGTATLHLSNLSNVHSLISHQVSHASGHHITVPTISLKTIFSKYGDIDLIRMDVEGYEQTILRSLVDLNKTSPHTPNILFELHPHAYKRNHFNFLLKDLYHLGYQADYLASSSKNMLIQNKCQIIAKIPTDGRNRFIAKNITLSALQSLAPHSRAVFLSKK